MGRIHRKIEALEKAASVWRKASERLAQERLGSFSHQETELLISVFGAEQAGRELSAAESAARKAYAQDLEAGSWQAWESLPEVPAP